MITGPTANRATAANRATPIRSAFPLVPDSAPTIYGMRKFPYPYDAMLAISSDADHETLRKFTLIHEFINTTDMTPMGRGVGLDFADSMFMYNGSNLPGPVDYQNAPLRDELSYFDGIKYTLSEGLLLNHYIHAGWIDTLHSFGDFSMVNPHRTKFSKELALHALATLRASHDVLTVWTDHGNQSNVDDFGAFNRQSMFWYQQGANPWSANYIANLVMRAGVRFIWADLPSSQFGHYSIIYPKRLPSGQRVWAFWRYTSVGLTRHMSPQWVWTADDLATEISIKNLLKLENLHQYAIVAQHLEADNSEIPLAESTRQALRLLAREYHRGHILVARTSRLLQYNVTQKYLRFTVTTQNGWTIIHLSAIADPVFGTHTPTLDEVRGVTFYTSNPARTRIDIKSTPVPDDLIQYNPSDREHPSISIRWFPVDTQNFVRVPSYGPWIGALNPLP